ncbi:MAG: hypothetical protein V4663_02795 [Bacteroidota bacterium]
MFDDFKKVVLNSYTERKAKNMLSDNLINPTRVKLKNECLDILRKRYDKKDDQTIKAFFDPYNEFSSHEQSIAKFDLDGFQALITFFKRNINIRKEENIKLLAWLIDFEPRPYVYDGDYTIQQKPETILENNESNDENRIDKVSVVSIDELEIINEPNPLPWKKIGLIVAGIIIALTIGIANYNRISNSEYTELAEKINDPESLKSKKTLASHPEKTIEPKALSQNDKQCMYWASDHYQVVACNQKINGAIKIALNQEKIDRLRKITDLDTVGKKDIGRVWYIKIKPDSVEFYTDSGSYPLDSRKILKPMTNYMLNKYILSKR